MMVIVYHAHPYLMGYTAGVYIRRANVTNFRHAVIAGQLHSLGKFACLLHSQPIAGRL